MDRPSPRPNPMAMPRDGPSPRPRLGHGPRAGLGLSKLSLSQGAC